MSSSFWRVIYLRLPFCLNLCRLPRVGEITFIFDRRLLDTAKSPARCCENEFSMTGTTDDRPHLAAGWYRLRLSGFLRLVRRSHTYFVCHASGRKPPGSGKAERQACKTDEKKRALSQRTAGPGRPEAGDGGGEFGARGRTHDRACLDSIFVRYRLCMCRCLLLEAPWLRTTRFPALATVV